MWVIESYIGGIPNCYPGSGQACAKSPNPANSKLACCRFRGHEDKIVTKELESGYDETEVQP